MLQYGSGFRNFVIKRCHQQGEKRFHPGGSVAEYAIQIDQKGDEAGFYTKVTAYLNDLLVTQVQKKPTAKK